APVWFSPQLQDRTSISPLCAASWASPGMPSSFRKKSTVIVQLLRAGPRSGIGESADRTSSLLPPRRYQENAEPTCGAIRKSVYSGRGTVWQPASAGATMASQVDDLSVGMGIFLRADTDTLTYRLWRACYRGVVPNGVPPLAVRPLRRHDPVRAGCLS